MERLVRYLSDEHIGGFLVLHRDPKWAATRLNGSQLRQEIRQHVQLPIDLEGISVEAPLVRILSLDGAHLFDLSGRLQLICQQLAPTDTAGEISEGGTKHATARRVAMQLRDAIVVAISHDGPITVYADGWKITPAGMEPY